MMVECAEVLVPAKRYHSRHITVTCKNISGDGLSSVFVCGVGEKWREDVWRWRASDTIMPRGNTSESSHQFPAMMLPRVSPPQSPSNPLPRVSTVLEAVLLCLWGGFDDCFRSAYCGCHDWLDFLLLVGEFWLVDGAQNWVSCLHN